MRSLIAGRMLAPNCARTDAGSGGGGSGDARYTAASTDSRNAASSMLQLFTRTAVTSPPGTWVTDTIHEMPGRAEGGLIQARCDARDDLRMPALRLVAVAGGIAPFFGLERCAEVPPRARDAPFLRRPSSRRRHLPRAFSRRLLVRGSLLGCGLFGRGLRRGLLSPLRRARRPRVPSVPARPSAPAPAFPARLFVRETLFFLLALDFGRVGLGRPLLFDGRRLGFGRRFGRFGRFGGSGLAARCPSARARRPRWLRWPASPPAADWCFQVNQPYTAAATMAECSSIDSAMRASALW